MGIALAFLALLSWGFGDFLIQRSTRAFGDWVALFYIEVFGTIVLLPFVWNDLKTLSTSEGLIILITASIVILFAALYNFEALRIGKISVIEPIYALEVPVTVLLATIIIREHLSISQLVLIATLILGIFLVSTKSFEHIKKIHLERGVWFAIIGTIAMGMANFLFGVGSRVTSPLLINWFTGAFIALVTIVYLASQKQLGHIVNGWRQQPGLVLGVSFFDNLAWVAYSTSMLFIPISIATGISESYIGLAAVLGLIYNHEKLVRHQWVGLALSVVSVLILANIT